MAYYRFVVPVCRYLPICAGLVCFCAVDDIRFFSVYLHSFVAWFVGFFCLFCWGISVTVMKMDCREEGAKW